MSPTLVFPSRGIIVLITPQLLQRNIDHTRRRRARMTGREFPSTAELEKRVHIIKLPTNDKRYNARVG